MLNISGDTTDMLRATLSTDLGTLVSLTQTGLMLAYKKLLEARPRSP